MSKAIALTGITDNQINPKTPYTLVEGDNVIGTCLLDTWGTGTIVLEVKIVSDDEEGLVKQAAAVVAAIEGVAKGLGVNTVTIECPGQVVDVTPPTQKDKDVRHTRSFQSALEDQGYRDIQYVSAPDTGSHVWGVRHLKSTKSPTTPELVAA